MADEAVDSNVILYLASMSEKAAIARGFIARRMVLSVQVLNETANVFTRKWKRSWSETNEFLSAVRELSVIKPVDVSTHQQAVRIAERHRLQFYDALIVASALQSGCDTLYSEDMHHGLVVEDRLRIVDPLLA